jgi:predicted small lipoprotein YifL
MRRYGWVPLVLMIGMTLTACGQKGELIKPAKRSTALVENISHVD